MQDNDSGSEQHGSWQPPEYVSPWTPAPPAAGAPGSDSAPEAPQAAPTRGAPDSGDTLAFEAEQQATPQPGQRWYEQPNSSQPAYQQPGYQQPGYQQPGYQQPGYQQPGYQQPGYQQPGYQQPWFGQPRSEQEEHGGPGYGPPPQGGYGAWSGGPGGQYPWGGYGTPPPPRGSRFGRLLAYVAVAALAAGAGAGAAIALNHSADSTPPASSPQINTNPGGGAGGQLNPFGSGNGNGNGGQAPGNQNGSSGTSGGTGPLNARAIAAKVDPGVVDITSTLKYNDATAEGTGMIISPNGLVLTNNHVIDQATSVSATLVVSGKTYPAIVVGYDSTDDVALLQLQGASGLTTVTVGDSGKVKVGQAVLALGNAGGRGGLPSTAQGSVSGLNRTIEANDSGANAQETLHGMLQTDAPIQEGDSGGPLVDSAGRVIGMDTAANTTGGFEQNQQIATTGFAIPINHAVSIANEIAAGHASATVHLGLAGFIGINVGDAGDPTACSGQGFGGFVQSPTNSGALICQVFRGTPAAVAGLHQGDVITSINGHTVTTSDGLTTLMAADHPGDQLSIGYVDGNGTKHTTTVTLSAVAK